MDHAAAAISSSFLFYMSSCGLSTKQTLISETAPHDFQNYVIVGFYGCPLFGHPVCLARNIHSHILPTMSPARTMVKKLEIWSRLFTPNYVEQSLFNALMHYATCRHFGTPKIVS